MPIGRYESPEIRRQRNDRWAGVRPLRTEQLIARIAELQAGQVHRDQLRELGLSGRAIDHRLAAGRLHRVGPKVYGVGHPRTDRDAITHAAVLTSGDGAALSHRAGAVRLGILASHAGPVEITVPGQLRARDGIRYYRRVLPPDEIDLDFGLPVTCAVRVLFDLAGVLPEWRFRRAIKEVDVRRLHCHLSLADLLERHPRPPGAAAIKAVVAQRAGPATVVPTDGEDRFAALVERAGMPMPSHRYGITLVDDWVEVDFAWPDLRVAVEVDSSFHEVEDAYETDHVRDQALMAEGWWVFRVTWRQLRFEPDRVLIRLERLLAKASADRLLGNRRISGVA